MKQFNFRKSIPHIVAVVIFMLLSVFMTKPALEGRVVHQSDVIQWKAMAQQSFDFEKKHGYFPRWTNSMFSGMPAYQIAFGPKTPNYIDVGYFGTVLTFGLPRPVYYLFIACLCFYLLSLVMGVNPWISIIGGIAYGFCSYNAVLIEVGHDTKLMSMAYAPAVLAGIQLIFKQRYWMGTALLLIFGNLLLGQSHQQIAYYTLLIILFMTIPFIIKCFRDKKLKHLLISGALGIGSGLIILGTMALSFWPTYELSQETMRGGRSELTPKGTDKKNATKGGLDKDYAFSWSYGKAETMTLMVPNAFGSSSSEGPKEESKVIQVIQESPGIPREFAQQIANKTGMYWGELLNTSGTVYFGAFICLLFLFGAFFSKSEHRWWLIAITVFGILLAWGKNLESINYFLFDHLPFYKKFRAPSMSLVIPQLTVSLLAVIFLNEFVVKTNKDQLLKLFKKCLWVTGSVIGVLLLFYMFADFSNSATGELRKYINSGLQGQNGDFTRNYMSALKADRQAFYLNDMTRSVIIMLAGLGVLFLYSRKTIKPAILYASLILLCTIDLFSVSKRYLKDEKFIEPTDYESTYADHAADLEIKKDSSFFRVLNLTFPGNGAYVADIGNTFEDAIASYKHKTIGGYSPAKLASYQDLRENQLYSNIQAWAANPAAKDSFPVLNMLNMKYIILPDQQNPRQTVALKNDFAMGDCWLVNELKFVKNADEEMNALHSFDPARVAFVDERFKASIPFMPVPDSTATIRLVENKNDEIIYEFNAGSNQFAVFSQIYYPNGWEAYIDDKKTVITRVDYALRGLAVPAGKHNIRFVFDPPSVARGELITRWSNWLAVLLVIFCFFMAWKKRNNADQTLIT